MDKPILYSTPMVQAIIDNRKRMTRRVAKEPLKTKLLHRVEADFPFLAPGCWANAGVYEAKLNKYGAVSIETPGGLLGIKPDEFEWIAPWNVGDVLWVRETWARCMEDEDGGNGIIYRADITGCCAEDYADGEPIMWRPSIFMPKKACRLWLRVTDIRPERLQNISEEDAKAEGVSLNYGASDLQVCRFLLYRVAFNVLWDDINAARGYSWTSNPWVWVITFERCEKPKGWPEAMKP